MHKNDDKLFACTADIVIDVVEMMVVDGGGGDDDDVNVDITGVDCARASQRNHRRCPRSGSDPTAAAGPSRCVSPMHRLPPRSLQQRSLTGPSEYVEKETVSTSCSIPYRNRQARRNQRPFTTKHT